MKIKISRLILLVKISLFTALISIIGSAHAEYYLAYGSTPMVV